MVSRRNYLSITLMMLVILFLFMLPQLVKMVFGQYWNNDYEKISVLNSEDAWKQSDLSAEEVPEDEAVYVIIHNDAMRTAVETWAVYTKRYCYAYATVSELSLIEEHYPKFIVMDSTALTSDVSTVRSWLQAGISVILTEIPSCEELNADKELMELVGIKKIVSDNTEMENLQLFEGFILGGETIFSEASDDIENRMDMNLQKPWILTDIGSKVYMVGNPCDEEAASDGEKKKELPALIWRVKKENAFVFVFDGDLFTSETAGGFLQAAEFELSENQLYPVVNAVCLTVANAPVLVDENTEKMQELYSRTSKVLFRDLFMPSIRSAVEQDKLVPTFMVNPALSYNTAEQPDKSLLTFFMQELKEIDAEAGYSFDNRSEISASQKLEKDSAFFDEKEMSYKYLSAYVNGETDFSAIAADTDIRTVIQKPKEKEAILSYAPGNTTIQCVTDDAFKHTCTDQLNLMCRQTAIGYSNVLYNMEKVLYPEAGDEWEILSDKSSKILYSYFRPWTVFEALTLTESDYRVRNFLNMNYSYKREDSKVSVSADMDGEGWFIFRSHNQEIVSVDNGTFTEIEKGAWLVQVTGKTACIELKKRVLN